MQVDNDLNLKDQTITIYTTNITGNYVQVTGLDWRYCVAGLQWEVLVKARVILLDQYWATHNCFSIAKLCKKMPPNTKLSSGVYTGWIQPLGMNIRFPASRTMRLHPSLDCVMGSLPGFPLCLFLSLMWNSFSGETNYSVGSFTSLFLYPRSFRALDMVRDLEILWVVAEPPAFWISSFSGSFEGLWSYVARAGISLTQQTLWLPPQFTMVTYLFEIRAPTAVDPDLSPPEVIPGIFVSFPSHIERPLRVPCLNLFSISSNSLYMTFNGEEYIVKYSRIIHLDALSLGVKFTSPYHTEISIG